MALVCIECFTQAGLVWLLLENVSEWIPGGDTNMQAASAALISAYAAKPITSIVAGLLM